MVSTKELVKMEISETLSPIYERMQDAFNEYTVT